MTEPETATAASERRVSAAILACFVGAAVAGAGLPVVYWTTSNIGIEGACLGACLILLAIGLVLWSHHLLPEGPYYEEYPDMQSPPAKEASVLATLDRGRVGRRKVLIGSLSAAGVSVAAGALSTLRSLGPAPNSLSSTPWKHRLVLVDSDGRPIKVGDLPIGGEISVYPQGFTEAPLVPAMLIHLPPGANRPLPGRRTWAPHDLICYSKVCSHAGCPVNLYDRLTMDMECPCHQSTFAVTRGGAPIFGPAAGPLAQLPLQVDPDGTLRSAGDFSEPPGPVFWHYSRGVAD
ncbi:MAG TPA: Rieske 2Fe-2S domain-containing protein [Acidimicrobiales bacterium]|nr:Rieske 2Fe-2S domain-containing protein [Acidimicrobiales bacterium]